MSDREAHPGDPTSEFPNRPDHPHFRLLVDLIKQVDDEIRGPEAFCEQEKVDEESLGYFMAERAKKAISLYGEMQMKLNIDQTIWVSQFDGFVLGYLFALNRTDQ